MTRANVLDIHRFFVLDCSMHVFRIFFVSGGRRTVFGWSSDGRPMVVGRLFSREFFCDICVRTIDRPIDRSNDRSIDDRRFFFSFFFATDIT